MLKKCDKIIHLIYESLYKELGEDFNTIDKSKNDWFVDYILNQERQDEITDEILNKTKLSKKDKQMIRNTIWLGVSPAGTKLEGL